MPLAPPQLIAHLCNDNTSVLVALKDDYPFIAYCGKSLGNGDINESLLQRGILGGGLDIEVFPGIIAEPSRGWMGRPGIQLRQQNSAVLASFLALQSYENFENSITLKLRDSASSVEVVLMIEVDLSGVIVFSASCENNGMENIAVDALNINLPVGSECQELLTLGGRHAMEAVEHRHTWRNSQIVLENRSGRTSHEQLGVVFAGTENFSEQSGEVWGIHCAWSGNFSFSCDSLTNNQRVVQVGELLQPGEVVLKPQEKYWTPRVIVGYSSSGINGVSQQFHRFLQKSQPREKRAIILNTWEAVYFRHDLETLKELAQQAADVGVERFVLDDGWFHGRRDDTAGLGDWWVDEEIWPQGLTPLVDFVTSLGLEFGLWCEPEMVNPKSELFTTHPEWALGGLLPDPLLGRNQLVLNMALPEVREYLFEKIDHLLSTHRISYVKWDHNRPLVGGASHAQTLGVYELLSRLTAAHPEVQFESCASGGGRIDMGIAQYVDRFWASDSIDALDRLSIQKGVTKLIPLDMMGSHIGSPTCHTTGRKHSLSFRLGTAMFSWLGVEWNLLELSEKEKSGLTKALDLYKNFRPLIHEGQYIRCDHSDESLYVHAVAAVNKSEVLLSVSRLYNTSSLRSSNILIPGLDPDSSYLVTQVENGQPRWALHRELPAWVNSTCEATGSQLSIQGLPCPPLLPESTMLIHVTKVNK